MLYVGDFYVMMCNYNTVQDVLNFIGYGYMVLLPLTTGMLLIYVFLKIVVCMIYIVIVSPTYNCFFCYYCLQPFSAHVLN